MPKKQSLTVEELKTLVLARFHSVQSSYERMEAKIQQELGGEVATEEAEARAIKDKLLDSMVSVMAGRLKRNRHSVPLLSSRDLARLIPSLLEELEQMADHKLDGIERKLFTKILKFAFEQLCEMVDLMTPTTQQERYEEYWNWINTVLELAAERCMPATELLALEEVRDEITRRTATKKQYIERNKKALSILTAPDFIENKIIQPLLSLVEDEAERLELEQELQTNIIPKLSEGIEKSKATMKAWFEEEVTRIYKTG